MPPVSSTDALITRARFSARRAIAPYPRIFLPLMRRRPGHDGHVVDADTEIMIEGFARSGNTFAVAAFEYAQQRPVRIARHLHAAGHVIEGVRRALPVMVLVRDPIDAIASQMIRHPGLTPTDGLRDYLGFYRRLLPYRDEVVVAGFDEVTTDFGITIDRVNRRFDSAFKIFNHTDREVASVFEIVDAMDRADRTRRSENSTDSVARPTPQRQIVKAEVRERLEDVSLSRLVDRARRVHQQFLASVS